MTLFHRWLFLFLFPFVAGKKDDATIVTTRHPFHIAVTEINHNTKEKSLEIVCKFFTDDFEQTMKKNYKTQPDISDARNKAHFDKYIPDYISKHLLLAADGKPVKLNYLGYESARESVYCYLEATNVASVKKLDIINSLLHDFTNDQTNIMHMTVDGKRQSTKLDYPASKASFQF